MTLSIRPYFDGLLLLKQDLNPFHKKWHKYSPKLIQKFYRGLICFRSNSSGLGTGANLNENLTYILNKSDQTTVKNLQPEHKNLQNWLDLC